MWFYAFLSSLGALLYEFSISQFVSILIGNSAFGYTFVVGGFLLSMGIGAWLVDRCSKILEQPKKSLEIIELLIPVIMIISLPLLSVTIYIVRQKTDIINTCQTLVCSNVGLLVISESLILLLAIGILVGMEIPLFNKISNSKLGKILAGDYLGAFVAGLTFSTLLLPKLGIFGVLILASFLHLSVAFFVRSNNRNIRAIWILLFVILITISRFYEQIEGTFFYLMTRPARAESSQVLNYQYTGKQFLLYTQDVYLNGDIDRRLFLDGFLQWSTMGGLRSYHQALTKIRSSLGDDKKHILILGGGDGLAANRILENYPNDEIQIVDFDCKLLDLFQKDKELNILAPIVWKSKNVNISCSDAFWFINQPQQINKWDLVLVDFPHGIGDAASYKVETYDFYSSIWRILKTDGFVSTHHEDYNTKSQRCLKKNISLAGFQTSGEATEGMGFIYGKKTNQSMVQIAYDSHYVQSELRLPCWQLFED